MAKNRLNRAREIIGVLIKYGFEDVVVNSTLRNLVPEKARMSYRRSGIKGGKYSRWELMRMCTEELGPTFVKMAQILSNRPDMIPPELVEEFEKLQDKVTPFSPVEAQMIIERETGMPIDDLFDNFQEEPLASASIGQVHRARLKSGKEVVVKVQRPTVKETVLLDLDILDWFIPKVDRFLRKEGVLNAPEVVAAFRRSIEKELDYNNEARNMMRFRATYKKFKTWRVPEVYREHSTDKVMIIEFARGCKITDVAQLKEWGLNTNKIVENGMDAYLTMIFEYGFFHADPHPGNVLVDKNGIINLIDFGMIGSLSQHDKYAFAGVFISLAQQDPRQMAVNMRKLAIEDEITDMRMFEHDLGELIEDYATLDVSEGSIAEMTESLQKIMFRFGMKMPGDIFLIFRAFAILEGIGKIMYPSFNTYEFIKPYGLKILQDRFKPQNVFNDVTYRFQQMSSFLTTFPNEVREIIHKTKRGKLHFEVELQGYGYLLKKMDSITNRLSITLIIVALIIASSIAMTADWPRIYRSDILGIPKVSLYALMGAGFFMVILLYSIIRKRKYK